MININLTFIAELIVFLMIVTFTRLVVIPPIIRNIQKRKEFINSKIEEMKTVDQMRANATIESKTVLDNAAKEYERILSLAHMKSVEERRQALENLQKEIDYMTILSKEKAEKVIIAAHNSIKNDIKTKSILIAEQVLNRAITEQDNIKLIDELIEQL